MAVVCPRCGSLGTLSRFRVGNREYCRVVHGRTAHYVGPCNEYIYVNKIFEESFGEDLAVQGLTSNNPIDNAINALELLRNPKTLKILASTDDEKKELIRKLEQLKKLVDEIAYDIATSILER